MKKTRDRINDWLGRNEVLAPGLTQERAELAWALAVVARHAMRAYDQAKHERDACGYAVLAAAATQAIGAASPIDPLAEREMIKAFARSLKVLDFDLEAELSSSEDEDAA